MRIIEGMIAEEKIEIIKKALKKASNELDLEAVSMIRALYRIIEGINETCISKQMLNDVQLNCILNVLDHHVNIIESLHSLRANPPEKKEKVDDTYIG